MTSNNSTIAGYLLPEDLSFDDPGATWDNGQNWDANPSPPYDSELDAIFQQLLVGMTGFDPTLVRPRWQMIVPNLPANTVNWVAVGIRDMDAKGNPYIVHQSIGQYDQPGATWDVRGQTFDPTPQASQRDILEQLEEFDVPCSFYGPNAKRYAAQVRDGLNIRQNRAVLTSYNMSYVGCGKITPAPELINKLWYYRADMIISIRRAVIRTYPIFDIVEAPGTVTVDVPAIVRAFDATSPQE